MEAAALEVATVVEERAGHLHAIAAPYIAGARPPCLTPYDFGYSTVPVAAGLLPALVPCLAATQGPLSLFLGGFYARDLAMVVVEARTTYPATCSVTGGAQGARPHPSRGCE